MKFQTSRLTLGALLGLLAGAAAKSGPTAVSYVEVNSDSIADVGQYTLSDGSNAFDIAIIFAANINYDGSAATLYNNDQVQSTLDNAATLIQPMQQKGIKVLLSLLGNHQGAGVSNFASQDAATAFAQVVGDTLSQYGLDGVDIDDEYADYGTNGTPQPNADSIGWFISALRTELGSDKLITFYNYGPASDYLSSADPSIGAQIDYSWNAIYGTYQAPSIPGMDNSKLSAAAVQIASTDQGTAAQFASQTISDGYGVYMTYALPDGDQSSYISAFTQNLYGESCSYSG